MISSMTGYGQGVGTENGFTFSVELRSVNHRYADFSLRLPRDLYALEDRIRRLLQESIKRGRVEVNLTLDEMPAALRQVKINHDLAEDYYRSLVELSERLGIESEVKLKHLLQVPELFKSPGSSLTEEELWPAVAAALEDALEKLLMQRKMEGENLCRDLLERCTRLEELVAEAVIRAERAKEDCRKRTEEKVADLLAGKFEETRLLMECALLVERMGIDEELVRLKSHLAAFRKIIMDTEAAGRKLDFIAQEMFREVNTIGSKAGDYQLTNLVVEMKAEQEKMREQIQNLE
ncbi:MAG: YicC family protein [Firmicutes bacterium]|nr:YicC family protein [Bacillota bacterium]